MLCRSLLRDPGQYAYLCSLQVIDQFDKFVKELAPNDVLLDDALLSDLAVCYTLPTYYIYM